MKLKDRLLNKLADKLKKMEHQSTTIYYLAILREKLKVLL